MKKWILILVVVSFGVTARAQAPAAPGQEQLEAMLKAVQAQQIAIAQNQAKIDEKLATLAETIRIARIYASRGGR